MAADPMIGIEGATFVMGSEDADSVGDDGEGPRRKVRVDAFRIDRTCVTNHQFEEFVRATGYQTEAERAGWSYVFHLLASEAARGDVISDGGGLPWWLAIAGAHWRRPAGRGSDLSSLGSHPVVHVSWNDATEYARWLGKRLPTEAEWERAARGGLEGMRFPWGDELRPGGEHMCNIWQGDFPTFNTEEDGFLGTAPADEFAPNWLGLHNASGNVWEWCSDWWSTSWHVRDLPETRVNPEGPPTGIGRVMRGGSYLCHESYCNRYRVAARTQSTPFSTSGNVGFRCAADA